MKLVKGNKQAGFSLVELMVVVGIIGILASLAVPRLQTFTAKAKISEGRAVVANAATLLNAYYAENSVYVPGQLGAAGAVIGVVGATTNAAPNAPLTAIGFNRVINNQMFYMNPGFVAGPNAAGNNVFTVFTEPRLSLCTGVNARDGRASPQMNQDNAIGFSAAAGAFVAPALATAGTVPANRQPRFICN